MPVETRHQTACAKRANREARCNCSPTYRAVRYHGKSPRTIKLFPSHAAARSWLVSAGAARQRGSEPVPTLREAAEALFDGMYSGAVLNRSRQRYKQTAVQTLEAHYKRHIDKELGSMRLDKIKRPQLQRIMDKLALTRKPPTLHNAIKPVAAVYRRAIRDEVVTENPCVGLEIERATGRRERIAPSEEITKLLSVLPEDMKAMFACAAYAGLRRGEILGLRWEDVDFDKNLIHVVRQYDVHNSSFIQTKSRTTRRVPMLSELRKLLIQRRSLTTEEVFAPRAFSTFTRQTRKIWEDAKMTPITLHECRHSFASICIDAGLNLKVIGSFLGHASVTTTMDIYGHLLPGSEESARDLMDAYLETKKGPPNPPVKENPTGLA